MWKVGGKAFAIGWAEEDGPGYTFKITGIAFEILKSQPDRLLILRREG